MNKILMLSLLSIAFLAGCEGRTAIIPVSDGELKKTSTEFAADAAKRAYKTDAPRGGDAEAQAVVDHGMFNRMKLINLSGEDWTDVEIWVNQAYVVHLITWPGGKDVNLKKINFAMLYNKDGKSFPTSNKDTRVEKLELFRNGKLYNIPMRLAD